MKIRDTKIKYHHIVRYYNVKQHVDQHTGDMWWTISCKAWNTTAEYASWECKDVRRIKEFEGNSFNPIFNENIQGRKHPGSCAFAEPELLSYRKPKRVVKKVKNDHKNPNNSHNYHGEYHDEIEFYQGNSNWSTY